MARVGRKREKLEAWKARIKSLDHELMLLERRKEHKRVRCLLGRRGSRKKCGDTVWKSRMTPSVAENSINRGRDAEEVTRGRKIVLCFKGSAREPRGVTAASAARGGERGTISCLSTKGCKSGHKRHKASRTSGRKKKSTKNTVADSEMEAELQGLQAGQLPLLGRKWKDCEELRPKPKEK